MVLLNSSESRSYEGVSNQNGFMRWKHAWIKRNEDGRSRENRLGKGGSCCSEAWVAYQLCVILNRDGDRFQDGSWFLGHDGLEFFETDGFGERHCETLESRNVIKPCTSAWGTRGTMLIFDDLEGKGDGRVKGGKEEWRYTYQSPGNMWW